MKITLIIFDKKCHRIKPNEINSELPCLGGELDLDKAIYEAYDLMVDDLIDFRTVLILLVGDFPPYYPNYAIEKIKGLQALHS